MSFISASYSVKKLSDKRYTSENTTLSTEAFVSPFDINAEEIYTDYRYIPTSSAGLPFSGSSQNLLIVSASSTDSDIVEGSSDDKPILKYWYRKKVRRGNQGGRSTFFFVEDDSFGANDAVFNDQLITSSQQTNFISPKYINATDAGNNTESETPGYKIEVSVGADAATATAVNNLTYAFDYKTGILSFFPNQTPAAVNNTSNFVFITAYQYVGRTLNSQIADGTLGGGSGTGFPFSGSAIITGSLIVSASTSADVVDFTNIIVSGSTFSGSFVGNGSGLTGVTVDASTVTLGGVLGGTAAAATFADAVVSGSGADNQIAIFNGGTSNIDGSSNLTFDGQTLTASTASITTNLSVGKNLTVTGDLTVSGTTTTVNSTIVDIGDNIIVLNSIDAVDADGGINIHITSSTTATTASLFYDTSEGYWAAGNSTLTNRIAVVESDPADNGFAFFSGSNDVLVSVAQGVAGAFLQSDGDGTFTVSNIIDGGEY